MDVLIPLHYFSSKLILVGDPLQLPATVKSNKALSLGFGKSLFERLFTHFMELNEQGSQYCVHLKVLLITLHFSFGLVKFESGN